MEKQKKLFRCPICYRGNVLQASNGSGKCTNCRNEFIYYKKTGTYFPKKYNKKYGNEKIRNNWRELYRQYESQKGLQDVEWDALANSKAEEYTENQRKEQPAYDGIETTENPGWAGAVLWPILIPIVGFIIGIVRMAKGGERKKSGLLCFLLSIFFMIMYVWIVISFSGGCVGTAGAGSVNPYIASVKGGYLESYPSKSIGTAINDFVRNPRWDTGITDDGSRIVNVKGKVSYMNKPTEILIQFVLHEDDSFEIYTMEINGEPISRIEQIGFLEAMYGE